MQHARRRKSFHLNIQLTQVKLNRSSSPPSNGKDQTMRQRTGVILYYYRPSQTPLKARSIFTSFPKDITRDYHQDGEFNLDTHIIQKTDGSLEDSSFHSNANKAGLRLKCPNLKRSSGLHRYTAIIQKSLNHTFSAEIKVINGHHLVNTT